jgi:hypothetical protein
LRGRLGLGLEMTAEDAPVCDGRSTRPTSRSTLAPTNEQQQQTKRSAIRQQSDCLARKYGKAVKVPGWVTAVLHDAFLHICVGGYVLLQHVSIARRVLGCWLAGWRRGRGVYVHSANRREGTGKKRMIIYVSSHLTLLSPNSTIFSEDADERKGERETFKPVVCRSIYLMRMRMRVSPSRPRPGDRDKATFVVSGFHPKKKRKIERPMPWSNHVRVLLRNAVVKEPSHPSVRKCVVIMPCKRSRRRS